jgi:hypothetical protein
VSKACPSAICQPIAAVVTGLSLSDPVRIGEGEQDAEAIKALRMIMLLPIHA